MDLSEEDKKQIKEWKANERRKKAYAKQIIKERKEYQSKLIELEREGENLNAIQPIEPEIKPIEPEPVKKRLYKAYYKCQTCNNSFNTLTILHKHLMLIKGCSFLSDTTKEVDKLLTRNMESLELKINSYKIILKEYISEYKQDVKNLLLEYYRIIEKADIFDL